MHYVLFVVLTMHTIIIEYHLNIGPIIRVIQSVLFLSNYVLLKWIYESFLCMQTLKAYKEEKGSARVKKMT